MANIALTVKTNFAAAGSEIKAFGALTESEAKRIEKFQSSFKSEKIDSFIQKNERAAAAVEATRGPLASATAEQAGLRRETERLIKGGLDPQSEALQKLQTEYTKATEKVEIMTKAEEINKNMTKNAAIALGVMTAAAVALGAKGVISWAEYSKSLANASTIIDITADEFDGLDDSITQMSNTFAIQKTELSSGVYQALSAGADDLSSALEIVEKSAVLGKGALIDNASAVDIVTTAMNAYEESSLSAGDAIDTYFKIVEQGKITGEELSQSIGNSISLFATAKIPIDELGAGLATLTKVGVGSAEATTQLNGIVNAFLKPSEAMAANLRDIGYESGSAFLEAEGLGGALGFITEASEGSIDTIAEMVPNIRGLRGALAAAANNGETFNEVLEEFNNKAGSADEALRRQTEGFAKSAFTVDQSKVIIENLVMALGGKLIPVVGEIANSINEFMTDEEKLNSVLDLAIPILAGVVTGLTGFLIITSIQKLVEGFSIAVGIMNAVLAANPLILVAAGLAALTVAVVGVTRAVKSNIEEMSQMSEIAGLTVGEVDQLTVAMETLSHEQLAGASFTTAAEDIATMAENLGITEEQAIRVGLAGEHITDQYKEQLQVLLDQKINQNAIDELSSTQELRQERILSIQEDRVDEEINITEELQAQQDIIDRNTETRDKQAEIVRQLLVWEGYYADGLIEEQAAAEKQVELRQALVNEIMAAGVEQGGLTADQKAAVILQQNSVKFWEEQVELMESANDEAEDLTAESAAIIPDLTEGNRIHEQIYQNLKYEVEEAENLGAATTESAEKTKLTWSEAITSMKDGMEKFEGVINATFTALEQSTQGFNEDSLEAIGDLVLEIGKATGSTEALVAGMIIKITAQIISLFDGIDQKEQEFQQGLTDLENAANLQRLSNKQDILDQEYNAEVDSIDAALQARLEAAGLADETAAESIQAKLDAAIAANDKELTAELEKEKQKQAIIDQYTQQKIDAEDAYNKSSRKVARETAIINRDIAIAQAKIDQQSAISDLGWFNKDKKADVNALYSDLIASISSIPLPALQTGTGPMGVVSSSSRADSTIVRVSEGEKITPRGEGQSITVNNIINEQLLYSITQKGIDSNEITITTDNIRTA